MSAQATLTQANPNHDFNAQPGVPLRVATSGEIGTAPAIIKIQHRVLESDPWVDRPDMTFTVSKHVAVQFTALAIYHRITVANPTVATAVNVSL